MFLHCLPFQTLLRELEVPDVGVDSESKKGGGGRRSWEVISGDRKGVLMYVHF